MNRKKVWKSVVGFEGVYSVSNDGDIRRDLGGFKNTVVGKILAIGTTSNGYGTISLCCNGKKLSSSVHKIVASAFFGPPPSGHQVNHINGNKKDNRVENLEYVTPIQNMLHAVNVLGFSNRGDRHGSRLHPERRPRGDSHGRVTVSDANVKIAKADFLSGTTKTAIAKKLGVSVTTVCDWINGKSRS